MIFVNTILLLAAMVSAAPSIYDFSFTSIDGEEISMADFKGKNILIVNTASKCGYTGQYKDLQALHEQYGKDLVIIGFPANNFGAQEPGSNEEIQGFCERNYGVTFLLSEKVDVKGEDIAPLFKYLTSLEGAEFTGEIAWNFEKFLIDKDGNLVQRYRSKVNPLSDEIVQYLKK
ncbi:glutathione peroxidase [Sphingobacterium sp. UT-1RO-CII-1]|uniref:glutathione peroxidase n=1 Tax=Sphingobacterium sp. UT-1RO-CII-1 TaxID=2995225 RepID=UPI00227A49C6|nr:glutathione peroxidase [Sphingobacterium sp. UT-1RO-CII-1]MCY4780692.1 glutathione peroxidase [Sphingobacterium sp. UT-1RO-CII-1]